MNKALIGLCFSLFVFNSYSQTIEDLLEKPDMESTKGDSFYSKKIIFVFGDSCDNKKFCDDRINQMKKRHKIEVKRENELLSNDYKEHLYFYGLAKWYVNWDKYNLPIRKIENGFFFGESNYTDKNEAICLVNSDNTRFALIGNTIKAFEDRGPRGFYDYFIVNNGKRIVWGNLTNNKYDSKRLVDSKKARQIILDDSISLKYLVVHYPDSLTNDSNYFDQFNELDKSLSKIIELLKLKEPKYRINAYVYKNKEQKVILCNHPGYGVAYPEWKEIDVIFDKGGNKGVLLHESIHILFDSEMYNIDNNCLLGEGIVGYTMSLLDSLKIKSDYKVTKKCFSEPIGMWFDGRVNSGNDIPSEKLYPISADWVTFLIANYGLDKFKDLYKLKDSELQKGYDIIYKKSIDELVSEFKVYVEK